MANKMKQENVDISITPETKLGALLETFPELEPVLMEMSPRYKKLRSPVLRKTVAKIATLHQVARIGNIPVKDLINRLRQKVLIAPGLGSKFPGRTNTGRTTYPGKGRTTDTKGTG